MLSQMTGENITGEYDLLAILKELSKMKKEYAKVHYAMDAVRQKGYGVVMPIKEEITLDTVLLGGMDRGLAKKDMQTMTIGEIVDFAEAWNERQKQGKEAEERRSKATKYRLATPEEISAYNRS